MRKLGILSVLLFLASVVVIQGVSNEINLNNLDKTKKLSLVERVDVMQNLNETNEISKHNFKDISQQLHLFTKVYGNPTSCLDTVVELKGEMSLDEAFERYKIEKETRKGIVLIKEEDVLFIGNSLIEGIRLYSNSDCQFLCKVGISLDGLKSKIYSQMTEQKFRLVVIGMGSNEMGSYDETHFKNSYNELINHIYSINPETKIYCLSVPPVSANKSNSNALFTNENVKIYSKYIKEICNERGLSYIDNVPFFGNVLQSDWTGDGIHLSGKVYLNWYSYIMENIIEV